MNNRFEKYLMYIEEDGKIIGVNDNALKSGNEAFILFKDLYDTNYGSIHEDGNLVSIHSGGWSENEELISEFQKTGWWFKYHRITAKGGHYYFNTDFYASRDWEIIKGQ